MPFAGVGNGRDLSPLSVRWDTRASGELETSSVEDWLGVSEGRLGRNNRRAQ